MAYKMIIAADRGWFFVQRDKQQLKNYGHSGPIIQRVAAWALTEDDNVVGLIGDGYYKGDGEPNGSQTFLNEPTVKANGEYVHYNDLTQDELTYLGSDTRRPNRANV